MSPITKGLPDGWQIRIEDYTDDAISWSIWANLYRWERYTYRRWFRRQSTVGWVLRASKRVGQNIIDTKAVEEFRSHWAREIKAGRC